MAQKNFRTNRDRIAEIQAIRQRCLKQLHHAYARQRQLLDTALEKLHRETIVRMQHAGKETKE